jgi:hypothetical protein
VWTGRILSAIVVLFLLADGAASLFAPQMVEADLIADGFPLDLAPYIGGIGIICAILYAIPATASLGAILITGFLGGAICTHFRLSEIGSTPQLICLALGVLTWGGLYLRDDRIRSLLPLRS